MSRYIDAKNLTLIKNLATLISESEVIDIVRCKECLLFNRTYHYCRHFNKMSVNTDDYCSYGERAKQTEPQTDCSWK